MTTAMPAQSASARKALTSGGGTDIFLAKYDRSGKLIWLTQAGGAGDDDGFDLAFDAAGNVYLTGEFTNSATFHGINGADQTVVGLGKTIFVAKYTPSGVLAWVQTGTATFDSINEGNSVAVEPVTGSVYVTGIGQGDTTFSSSNGTTHSVAGPWTWHMVLVKYDTAGNFQWGQTNQAEPNSNSRRVAVDTDNNVYATGWMEGRTTPKGGLDFAVLRPRLGGGPNDLDKIADVSLSAQSAAAIDHGARRNAVARAHPGRSGPVSPGACRSAVRSPPH